jgi:hypothetical protein
MLPREAVELVALGFYHMRALSGPGITVERRMEVTDVQGRVSDEAVLLEHALI